ncbi:MAG: glycosyltransferase [Bacteroidota bacterium]
MKKKLHIICLTVPYPANYGGVFDLYYMLPALKNEGVSIHLHCFDYGRGQQPALNEFCEEVFYYPRNQGHKGMTARLPYIVSSRKNEKLLERLLLDNAPILMHGIHCTYLLTDERFRGRHCVVRLHNVEHIYYRQLANSSNSLIKSIYYLVESYLLKKYEKRIANLAEFVAVSEKDVEHYRKQFQCKHICFVPVFLPNWQLKKSMGMGTYCLFHGDLQVPLNERTAISLLTRIFHRLKIPFVIAGRNPSPQLMELAHREQHTCLVANPSDTEMEDMIARAHLHILPAQHNTGIQLKLLHALYQGRHCIVNAAAITQEVLAPLVQTAESDEALTNLIKQVYQQPLGEEEFLLRHELLDKTFDSKNQARAMIGILFPTDK